MVLHHVADRADFLVKVAASLNAKTLGHRDLHVIDVVAIPDRLEKRVGEAEGEEVLHRFLAKEVVDSEYGLLRKHRVQGVVEFARGSEASAERFFDDDTRVGRAPGFPQTLNNGAEHARRYRQIMQRAGGALEYLLQPDIGG